MRTQKHCVICGKIRPDSRRGTAQWYNVRIGRGYSYSACGEHGWEYLEGVSRVCHAKHIEYPDFEPKMFAREQAKIEKAVQTEREGKCDE